jgi:hypothetical protein
MSVMLFANGNTGDIMICTGGITNTVRDNYIAKPIANIANIHFHSGLDYMYMKKNASFSATIVFPIRYKQTQTSSSKGKSSTYDVPSKGEQSHSLGTHNLGYIPFATTLRTGGIQTTPTAPIQVVGSSSRLINVEMTTTGVFVYEQWVTYGSDLPQFSQTFTVWIFEDPQ